MVIKLVCLNFFVIQFPNSITRDKVLESRSWHIHNKSLIVKKWEASMDILEFNMEKLPIWIHLRNVPLELFSQTGLSYRASAIGNPLYMDRITIRKNRLIFAKICVKIGASIEIPRNIKVDLGNGKYVLISVEVPWYP